MTKLWHGEKSFQVVRRLQINDGILRQQEQMLDLMIDNTIFIK